VTEDDLSLKLDMPNVLEVAKQLYSCSVTAFGKLRLSPPYLGRLPAYDELDEIMRGNIDLDNLRFVICLAT